MGVIGTILIIINYLSFLFSLGADYLTRRDLNFLYVPLCPNILL